MQSKEGKVDSSKALDASLVVIECSGTKSDKQDTSSRSGNDTHAEDVDIKPVNEKEPMARVQLTAQHNVLANEQQHFVQSEPIYDTHLLEKVDRNTTPDSTNMCIGEERMTRMLKNVKFHVSDNKEENVSQPKIMKKTVKPSIAKIDFVKPKQQEKTTRKTVKQAEKHRQNTHSPRGNQRNWNNRCSKTGSNFETFNKASLLMVNHQNFAKKSHPCAKKNMVPRTVLMKSGLVSINTTRQNISKTAVLVNTARQVNVAHSKTTVNAARPMGKNVNIGKPKAVVNAVKGNNVNAVKASACWVWKPKNIVLDHGNPQMDLQNKGRFVAFGGNPKERKSQGKDPQKGFFSHDDGSKPCNARSARALCSVDEDPRKDSECNDQEKEDNVNSTNNVNAASTNEVNVVGGKTSIELLDDLNMPALEDYSIFDFTRDDEDDGVEADMNNLNTTIQVSPNPTIRIHKDHPLDQVIGDLQSTTQTRKMSKNLKCNMGFGKIEEEVYVCQKPPGYEIQTFLIGLQVKQKKDGIFISQDKYVTQILKKFDFTDVKTANTPMETQKLLLKDEDGEEVDVNLYRSMISSLMYLTSSRPDIMFAVCACARYQVNPKVSHLHAVKRIFRYLKGQLKLGLWYLKDSPFDLVAYTDSDYTGASLDRKSTTGGYQFLGSRLISWQCKKQTVVANSTIEAEYVAALSCCGQVLWIHNQLLDYGYNFLHTKIFIDNNSTICIIKNPVFHSKRKHIEIRHQFIRDYNENKLIHMVKIHTDKNVADLLTKAFDANVKVKIVNGEVQLQALVDRKKIIVTEASVRRDLQLNDEEETKTRKPKRKDTQIPQSSGPTKHVADEAVYKELDDSLVRAATTASSLEAKQDSGNITKTRSKATPNKSSSLGTTLGGGPRRQKTIGDTIVQTRFENVSKHSNDLLLARGNTLQSGEDSLKLIELMELCTNLQTRVLDLEKTKTTQAEEIVSLKKRIKKLEQKKRPRTHGLKRLYKVGLTARVESSRDKESLGEDASKQVRINANDADEDIVTPRQGGNARRKQEWISSQHMNRVGGSKEKRAGIELRQEIIKKQKVEDDKEIVEIKKLMEIILDEEEVIIDAIPLAVKSPSIVDWKIS
ncbi:hypothetical protein Tco_0540862 [Tanacetum coccineum]